MCDVSCEDRNENAMNKEEEMKAQRDKKQAGFTLLELLMVVIIIAILASIALPQYFRTVRKAQRSEALSALATIRSAQMRYKSEFGGYAADLTPLDITYDVAGSNNWTYTTSTAGATAKAQAAGVVGAAGCALDMDVGSGVVTGTPAPDGTGC